MNNPFAELETQIGASPVERLPELLGQLERLKGHAWARLLAATPPAHQSLSSDEQLLTLPQVAERLNIPQSRAYELARQHKLPAVRIGKYVRVPLRKLQEYQKALPRL